MNRENVMRAALSDLEAQRANNMEVERKRRMEACAKSPEIARLLDVRQKLFYSSMRNAFSSPEKAKQISDAMKLEMENINKNLRIILQKNGLPEDYLQPVYRCPLCKDTGYVGEPVHEPCVCLKRAVLNKLYQNEGLQGLEYQNFKTFDESIFPDTPIEGKKLSQRAYIQRYRAFCEEYANSFKPGEGKGLLLCGRSGLGKTFLMNCVAQRVLELGYSVVVISAYKLVELMRSYQFDGRGAEQVQDILTCDLLAIDDLGSEPMLRGVTLSAIYHIVNERNNANRAIVVTTNCSSDLLYEKYDDRIAARLTAPSKMSVIEFMGVDVRRYVR
ncbi:MAG: ATP-binding protein [Clostridiales bacterium]|nr:ATP-binding protein [Clostridiales bacterium]